MNPLLTPLFAVFGIMLLGSLVQKLKLLPADTDAVLNQYVYYIAFPAILFVALAQTPIDDILQWGFIGGYFLAMLITYAVCVGLSLWWDKQQTAIAAIRGLNATFGNTAFIGIPLLMLLYPGQQLALAAAAIASFLSVLMFAIALVTIEVSSHQQPHKHPIRIMLQALAKNPIVLGSLLGVAVSASHLSLPDSIAMMMRQLGNTSSPCALFAIGMVLCKALRTDNSSSVLHHKNVTEIGAVNLFKMIVQPIIAYLLLSYFGVEHDFLTMGVLLAAMPTAASVYLLAHKYQLQASNSAQGILFGTLISFLSLPLIQHWLS